MQETLKVEKWFEKKLKLELKLEGFLVKTVAVILLCHLMLRLSLVNVCVV